MNIHVVLHNSKADFLICNKLKITSFWKFYKRIKGWFLSPGSNPIFDPFLRQFLSLLPNITNRLDLPFLRLNFDGPMINTKIGRLADNAPSKFI
jgi:hypothetical protein